MADFNRHFLKVLQQMLMAEWDPIGVRHFLEVGDEYDTYAMRVYSLLISGANADQIATYLMSVETEMMGFPFRSPLDLLPVAEHIVQEWEKTKPSQPNKSSESKGDP